MQKRRTVLAGGAAAVATLVGLGVGGGASGQAPGLVGEWTGVLQVGSAQLRLRLVIGADGSAALYSIDQGNEAIPASAAALSPTTASLRFAGVNARYEGALENGALVGTFTQGGAIPLRFERGEAGLTAPRIAQALTAQGLGQLLTRSRAPAIAAAARGAEGRSLDLAVGVRQRGAEAAVTTGDLWHVGSITKSMTATLVAKLVEEGLLSWDAPLSQMLEGVAMREEYRAVTLRHLLSHRSGLTGNIPIHRLLAYPREEADARANRVVYAAEALSVAPEGPAGVHFEYSNSGYVIAGAIIENVAGQAWEAVIQERLFAPLGVTSAGFGAPGTPGAVDQPSGHARGMGRLSAYLVGSPVTDNPAVLGPAGRAHMSLADLLLFAGAHRDRSAYLRPESWAMLHTPPFGGDYAMGLIVRADGVLWHNGSNTLWYAELLIDAPRRLVAAAAANSGAVDEAAPAVGEALMGAAAAVG